MNNANSQVIREAVGIFFNGENLHRTTAALITAGFKSEQLGLLASEYSVQESLGDFYAQTNKALNNRDPAAPHVSFVKEQSIGDTAHGFAGGLVFVGSTVIGAVAIWTAALIGSALAVAIAGSAAVGAVGGVMLYILRQSDAEYLAESVDEGHLLLFVRTADKEQERKALDILSKHSVYDARIYEVPADKIPELEAVTMQRQAKDNAKEAWII